MAVTQDSYVGNGSRVSYPFTFPYLKASDVKASIDAVATTAFTLTNATTLQFNTAPASGAKIKIFRETGIDSLSATFYAGSAIKSEDLNDNFTQNLYVTQEVNGRYISALGGTMTGNLNFGEDVDIVFEGATDDAHETTLTVADPTADRTITFPDTTGTVVTTGDTGTVATGMIANDAINGTKIADDSINSEHYVDGSIDTAHIADAQVTGAKLAADSVNGTKIADDSIDSEHYVDGSIDTAHIGNLQVTTAKIADGNITHSKIQDNAVITAKIADGQVTNAKIAADAVTNAKIADNSIDSEHYVDGSIDTAHIGDSQITSVKIADGTIVTGDIANDAVTTAKIADAELKTLAGMQSGTASKLADSTALTADIADLNQIDGLTKQTTLSDTDASFPTSGAVVDYVTDRIDEIGGFEAITNELQFPNTQPVAGVAISIADAGGIVVNSSGTSTTGRTVGGSTVTINGIASNFNSSTVANGIRFIVTSTGSGQVYNYHKATLKEDDLVSLSGDINDFSERYRVGSSNPTSSLDSGDLFFNTGTGKLLVYNGTNSAWEEAQSIGNFFISTLSPAFDGTTQNFSITNAPTSVQQIILSINGVVQKPNAGTSTPSEGFALDGSTIKLSAAPAAGDSYFAIVMGSTVNIGTPSDNTVDTDILQNLSVSTAKIQNNAVTTGKIADQAVDLSKLPHGTSSNDGKFLRANNGADPTFETVDLANLSASNLTSGTIPDARFPATLPAASAANLTSIPSANLTGALPALDGSALTGVSSPEVYGFNTNSSGNLIVTTTNGGANNISGTAFDAFDDVIFAATGFTFSVNANGKLIATI